METDRIEPQRRQVNRGRGGQGSSEVKQASMKMLRMRWIDDISMQSAVRRGVGCGKILPWLLRDGCVGQRPLSHNTLGRSTQGAEWITQTL